MDKLDPHLKSLYLDWQTAYRSDQKETDAAPETEPPEVADRDLQPGQRIAVFLMFEDDLDPLTALGFKPRTVVGHMATGTLALEDLEAISAHPNVQRIALSRPMAPELDNSIRDIKAHVVRQVKADRSGWEGIATGKGVIVGVVDSGINFTHQSFRNNDGTSRILAIWDQSDDDTGPTPKEYGQADGLFGGLDYGSVFDKEAIDDALKESNPVPIPHKDSKSGHGTHVAGIAAGNGRQDDLCVDTFTYSGVAPDADLVIVKFSGTSGEEQLGEDTNLVDALSFVNQLADHESKPAVTNISLGDNLGAHDGTNFVEIMIDLIYGVLSEGKALVKSAGNEGNNRRHATDTVPAGDDLDLPFTVNGDDRRRRLLSLWYPGADSLDCVVVPPSGPATGSISPNDEDTFDVEGGGRVRITSENPVLANSDGNIVVELIPPALGDLQAGTWNLRLTNPGASDVEFHCWLERHLSSTDRPPKFDNPSHEMTLSIPGTARNVIVVANYITKGDSDNVGKRHASSSLGPTRDARPADEQKPDIAAPGTVIMSARGLPLGYCEACLSECCDPQFHTKKLGTSMAAPHVTGTIALMLEKEPSLAPADTLSILRDSARTDAFTSTILSGEPDVAPPNIAWGAGKLDADEAVEQAIIFGGLPLPEPDTDDAPEPVTPPVDPIEVLRSPGPPPLVLDLDALQAKLDRSPAARHYADLVETHFEEVMRLINTNKRVATVWHRNGGPMIVRAVLRSLAFHDEPLPEIINGVSLRERLTPFINIVRRYAGPQLVCDIEQHEALLWQLPGKSLD
ncbi:MAG: S8 family serine peptidase, partial [Chloroflexota bacterium]